MKKSATVQKTILITLIIVLLLPSGASAATRRPAWASKGTVAHACGGIDNYSYVNSENALRNAIAKGAKSIEIDFAWSNDHTLICAHKDTDFTNGIIPALKDYITTLFMGRYQRMTAETALRIMSDANRYLIVDTQEDDAVAVYAELKRLTKKIGRKSYMKRIVPQIYSKKQYKQFRSIYKFPAGIFTLYKARPWTKKKMVSVVKFCKTRKLTVTINCKRWTKTRERIFKKYKVPVAVHTINNKKQFKKFKKKAIIYTDFLY